MFPPIEPFATGMLPVSDGNQIYWETSGNPEGKPALHLHGGPGGGIMTGYRRRFDPEKYLIVGFEQRGCGRSRPLATHENIATNTTQALIADIEALREHLGIKQWLVTGLSWGTTLSLAYAQAHPDRVSEIVLLAVTNTTPREVEWITEATGMGNIFPREWDQLAAASGARPGQRIIDAMYERITDPDPAVRAQAAQDWVAWEDTHISLDPNASGMLRDEDPGYRQIFATLVLHYWKHGAFLGDTAIRDGMDRIAHIPGVLIHGRMDISSPMRVPWEMHKAWPGSELIIVDDEGHGGDTMIDLIVDAYARLAP
jgi:proline iminopeptidase